jgi:antitoxin component YwqK of YwqJK toxin-antitoxin module
MRYLFFILLIFQITLFSQAPKNGYIKKTDEKTNKLLYEGMFKNDQPIGKFKYYYPNDSVRAIVNFHANGNTAYARLFHPNGKRMGEGKYTGKEIKDSVWTFYDESGKLLSREKYKAGKKEGTSFVYLPDGSISQLRNFKDGVEHGPFKDFFSKDVVKASSNYENGKMEGRVSYYYPNGVEAAAGYFRNGVKNGAWIYKTEEGKIKEKELYINGMLASPKETEAFFSKNKFNDDKPAPAKTAPSGKTSKKKSPGEGHH